MYCSIFIANGVIDYCSIVTASGVSLIPPDDEKEVQ